MATNKKETELLENSQSAENGQSLTDQYLQMSDRYLNAYRDNKYSYDFANDPIYKAARDAYVKQGETAAKNTAANAAKLTGGYGNSYGAAAAQQQRNTAAANVNNLVPDLEAQAYGRWQDELSRNMALANAYQTRSDNAYNRQWSEAQTAAAYMDYSGLNKLGVNTAAFESQEQADRDWELLQRERQQKEWTQADEEYAYALAINTAQFGDYSKLKALGVDVSTQEKRDTIDLAIQWAEYGDYSLLEKLGLNTAYLKEMQKYTLAAAAAAAYGYSGGSGGSGGGGSGRSSRSSSRRSSGSKKTGTTRTTQNTQQTTETVNAADVRLAYRAAVADGGSNIQIYGDGTVVSSDNGKTRQYKTSGGKVKVSVVK